MVKAAERAEWLVCSGEESERKTERERRDWKERGITKKKKEKKKKKERRNRERSSLAVINEDRGGLRCVISLMVHNGPPHPFTLFIFFKHFKNFT